MDMVGPSKKDIKTEDVTKT